MVNPESVCWGSQFASTGVKNGRCEPARGGCVCRSGTVGQSCNEQGMLQQVDTNGDEFVDGIPIGELLLIQWNSTLSDLPRVNILLTKNLTSLPSSTPKLGANWANGLYLASNVRNSGFFQWTVGEHVKEALEAGTGYRIVVWFSKNLWAQSDPFAISDPCAYKSQTHTTCIAARSARQRSIFDSARMAATHDALFSVLRSFSFSVRPERYLRARQLHLLRGFHRRPMPDGSLRARQLQPR